MSKITQVEPQKSSYAKASKRRGIRRFNVFLDGQFAFGADEDLVVSYRLIPGKEICENDLNHLIFEADTGKLMEKMYRLFSIRQRSEKEVREYLRMKNYELRIKEKDQVSQLVIDALVETLKKKGMVNDLEFAKAWVEARRRSKNLGVRALKVELFKKGIGREIIEEVLSSKYQVLREEELAAQALEKKIKAWKNLDNKNSRKKATEFLLRKGFEYEMVKKIVENILKKD